MNNLRKNLVIVFIIGIAVFAVGNGLSGGFNFTDNKELLLNFTLYQLYSFVLGFSNMLFFQYLEKLNWKPNDRLKRIAIGILGSVLITLTGLFFLRSVIAVTLYGKNYQEFLANETFDNYKFGLWITLTIVIIFHFVYFYNQYQKQKIKEQKVIAGTARAKFDALKNQLDPHFLFNSLNVLTSLIEENPGSAQKFTTSLSKVYRYVLEQKNKDLVTIDEELQFAKTYMSLLQMRYEDAIKFSMPETTTNPELKIVPLSLQLLLENAVKHNVITSDNPLEIKIYEDTGYLVIENNVNPKASMGKSTKVGLKNINQRYSLITKRAVEIIQTNQKFKVRLPLLTQEINIMRTKDYSKESNKYIRAKQRVDELKGFYGNLISYCVVIPFLAFINYKTYWGFQWFWFPLAGWGIGLLIHAFSIFGYGSSWEERKIRELMDKDEF